MNIGGRLKKLRSEQKLTAKQLERLSGVSENTIYRIERGEVTDPKLSSIEPLIRALNCSADELLFDADNFTKLGTLRQLFAVLTQTHDAHQDLVIEVIQKLNLAHSLEKQLSEAMKTAKRVDS